MEIREFAETLLFSGRLEDKLRKPEQLTDAYPGRLVLPPALPARTADLAVRSKERKSLPFRRLRDLERGESAMLTLHHFANHELLAIELMALALLRFVEAPADFRKGLVETIADEQAHLHLYVERIAGLGGTFGQHPLNGFFWHSMSTLETPLAFIAAMSLTFEQANLDYANDFRRAFARIGDETTSIILKRILKDEIGHVRFGTRWLNAWREPNEDDWTAYLRALPANLSARRARGPRYLVGARRAAGLSDHFIEELRLFSHTQGRPPRVFVFNPTCEDDIAAAWRHPSSPRPKHTQAIASLEADLAPLMMFLASESDVVEVPRRPSNAHLNHLIQAGFSLPEFRELGAHWPEAKIAEIVPWGVSPQLRTNAEGSRWPPSIAALPTFDEARAFSKCSAATWLRIFLESNPDCGGIFGADDDVGQPASTFEDVERVATSLWARGRRVLVKAPLSSSGRHRIMLAAPDDLKAPAARAFIERHLAQAVEPALLVEPYLDRVMDLSLTFFVTPEAARSIELTRFFTSQSGRYLGHRIGAGAAFFGVPVAVLRDLQVSAPKDAQLDRRLGRVAQHVARELAALGYEGPAGIDVLVHRVEGGRHLIKPIVEVNPRLTMGHIARALAKHLAPGQPAEWRHVRLRDLEEAGTASPRDLAAALLDACPPALTDASPPRLASGIVFTNDPEHATVLLSILAVGKESIEQLRRALPGSAF